MNEVAEKLRECPFCGAPPIVDNIGSGQCARIFCNSGRCTVYPSARRYGYGDALEKATTAWNTRAESDNGH